MKMHSFGFFRSSSSFQNSRSKVRWTEWLIAVFFVISLLIASGVFIKASNAASLKSNRLAVLSQVRIDTIPGPMRAINYEPARSVTERKVKSLSTYIEMEDKNSCELKEPSQENTDS